MQKLNSLMQLFSYDKVRMKCLKGKTFSYSTELQVWLFQQTVYLCDVRGNVKQEVYLEKEYVR